MAEVIDIDKGWKIACKRVKYLDGKQIKAGVLWSAGTGKNGVSIAFYASCNEYGTYGSGSEWQRIPARPFMGKTADEQRMWKTPVTKAVDRIIGGAEVIAELNVVGEKMKKDIKNNIGIIGKYKPLAPSTVAKKGHNIPLMDSGALYDSIDFEVK